MSTTTDEVGTFQSIFSSLKDFALGAVDTVSTGYGAYLDKKTAYTEAQAALQTAQANAADSQIVNDGIETTATTAGLGNINLASTQGLLLVGGGALVLLTFVKALK